MEYSYINKCKIHINFDIKANEIFIYIIFYRKSASTNSNWDQDTKYKINQQ